MKVEAIQRLNNSATEVQNILKLAVISGIRNSEKSIASPFSAPPTFAAYGGLTETTLAITGTEMEDYFTNDVLALYLANPLQEIAIQKYLSFF